MKRTGKSGRGSRQRVFVFGAGLSASCGIAVVKDILRESMVGLSKRDSAKAERVHRLLQYLYPSFDLRLRNYPNIEDFLNLLEMAKKFNTEEFIASSLWPESKLNEVKNITLKAVTDYLWGRMANKESEQPVRQFVNDYMRQGDIVITFNWDLIIERALEEYRQGPGFIYTYSRKWDGKGFSLLKPHGSIDWFERKKLKGLKCEKKVREHDREVCYYPYFELGKNPELANVAPVIVPPVSAKEMEFSFLRRTWKYVYRALSDATTLHIIGYSMPKEDQFARLVFRRAVRNNILKATRGYKRPARVVVVNPDESAEGTFSRLVGDQIGDFIFYQSYFQDFVSGLAE